MSIVTLEDRTNDLLKRRELVCLFRGQAGKLQRSDAIQLLSKELKLGKKLVVVPIKLKSETGKADLKGTFYVYDDEELAKKHLPKYIFKRLTKKEEEEEKEEEKKKEAEAPPKEEAKEAEAKEEKKAKAPAKEEAKKEKEEKKKEGAAKEGAGGEAEKAAEAGKEKKKEAEAPKKKETKEAKE